MTLAGLHKKLYSDPIELKKGTSLSISYFKKKRLAPVNFVYKIINTKNNKFYIGVTKDIWSRIKTHMSWATHTQSILGDSNDWRISILEVVTSSRMDAEEIEADLIRKACRRKRSKCVNRLVKRETS